MMAIDETNQRMKNALSVSLKVPKDESLINAVLERRIVFLLRVHNYTTIFFPVMVQK